MSDFDRRISDALKNTASDYEPNDLSGAQRVFVKKRRRRRGMGFAGGAVAVAAVMAAVAVFPRPELTREDRVDVASRLQVAAVVEVGDSPSAVAVDWDGVWVANAGDGTVMKIDSTTNRVVATIDVDGTPDEVAVGDNIVWAALQDGGSIVRIDPYTNTITEQLDVVEGEGPAHLDIAADVDRLWVAHQESGRMWLLDDAGLHPVGPSARGTDVAVLPGESRWAYDGRAGVLTILGRTDDPTETGPAVEGAPVSENADLATGSAAVWVSNAEGGITRFEAQDDFGRSTLEFGGRHSDLAFDAGSLWAVTAQDDETATLRRLDSVTGELLGQPLELDGRPVDVTARGATAWVANQAADTVTRVSTEATPEPLPSEPSPEAEPDVVETPSEGAQIMFAFEANGDIYLEYDDGTSVNLTESPVIERNPTFYALSLFFERHDGDTGEVNIFEYDFVAGEEELIAQGREPAASPGGDIAYIDGEQGNETLYVARMNDSGELSPDHDALPLSDLGLDDFRSLEWSDDAKTLYLQGHGDGWVTLQIQVTGDLADADPFVLNGANDQPPGATFVQPDNATDRAVEVAVACCREVEGDPYTALSIGRIAVTEGGPAYEEIVPGVLERSNLDPAGVYFADMHELALTEDGWEMFTGTRSWIVVVDTGQVFLVTETGETRMLYGGEDEPFLLEVPVNSDFGSFDLNPSLEGDLPG